MFGLKHKAHSLVFSLVQFQSNGKPKPMKPFNPLDHGLPKDFILTNYTKMKG